MLLPPQVLLVLRPHGCQHVVRVHDDVHERIDETHEYKMTTGHEPGPDPTHVQHERVVVQMEERHLAGLLPQHEEHRVQELGHFSQVKHVDSSCYLLDQFIVG